MTNQEAIEILKIERDHMTPTLFTERIEAMNMAISALEKQTLPSEQPRQTDCGYCHEDFDGYVRPINKNSHAWLVRRGRTMKLRVCFKGGYSECDILFCPMCGRRLTDG